MNEQEEVLKLLFVITVLLLLRKRQQNKRRKYTQKRFGVRPIFLARKRQGFYENLLQEARVSDHNVFFNFTRMTPSSFDRLLTIVGPQLSKSSNREPISPGCR